MQTINRILNILRIKHSNSFLKENYMYSPNNGNLLGMQRILKRYGIASVGIHFTDKMNAEITVPCICHFPNQFVVVQKIENRNVYFDDGKRMGFMNEDQFCDKWDGVTLLISDYSSAKEPDYFYNKIQDYYQFLKYRILLLCLFICAVSSIITNKTNIIIIFNIILDFLGLIVCLLLLQKENGYHSTIANKVCSLVKKENCNTVINTKEAYFLNLFSLSEIGTTYFLSSIIFLFFLNRQIFVIQTINWLAMLFGIWSIWFQFVKIKQICALCCITQTVIWFSGLINLFNIQLSTSYFRGLCIYGTIFTCCLIFIKIISDSELYKIKSRRLRTNLLQIKGDEKVFYALSNQQERVLVPSCDSKIILGNINAKNTVTVVTNPHCSPCANAHIKLMNLIKSNTDIKIQYVFTEFSSELRKSSLFMIAVLMQKKYDEVLSIMSDWYDYGRFNSDDFISHTNVDVYNETVLKEYEKHTIWIQNNNITSTPFVIYNGVPKPPFYEIEDIEYISISPSESR